MDPDDTLSGWTPPTLHQSTPDEVDRGTGEGVYVRLASRTVYGEWDLFDDDGTPMLEVVEAPARKGDAESFVGEVTADCTAAELLEAFGPGTYYLTARRPGSQAWALKHRVTVGRRTQRRRARRADLPTTTPEQHGAGQVAEVLRAQLTEKAERITYLEKQLERSRVERAELAQRARAEVDKLREMLQAERLGRITDRLEAAQAQGVSTDQVKGWIAEAAEQLAVDRDEEDAPGFADQMVEELGKLLPMAQMLQSAS